MLPLGDNWLFLGAGRTNPYETDRYFLPRSTGQWLWFCADATQSQCIFPSAFNFEPVVSTTLIYTSYARINGKDALFHIQIDTATSNLDTWAVFDDGSGIPSKDQYRLQKGDTLMFYYNVIAGGSSTWQAGDQITFTEDPVITVSQFNADNVYMLMALDFKGNVSYSTMHARSGAY